jgi:hypothetical protein
MAETGKTKAAPKASFLMKGKLRILFISPVYLALSIVKLALQQM